MNTRLIEAHQIGCSSETAIAGFIKDQGIDLVWADQLPKKKAATTDQGNSRHSPPNLREVCDD